MPYDEARMSDVAMHFDTKWEELCRFELPLTCQLVTCIAQRNVNLEPCTKIVHSASSGQISRNFLLVQASRIFTRLE